MKLATESGREIAETIRYTDCFLGKLFGLAGRRNIPAGEGIIIKGCAWVHTFFMRFAIDILYLDSGLRILRIDRSIPPWRLLEPCPGASTVLELAGGTADKCGLAVGERLVLRE